MKKILLVCQYDSWGNLLYKRTYAYTTGTLGTVQETVTYTYGNSSWKDQLTSYNGQSITYDASGNPTSYLGQHWYGRDSGSNPILRRPPARDE